MSGAEMIIHMKSWQACALLSLVLLFLLSGCASKIVEAPPPAEPTRDPNLEQAIEQQLRKINSDAIPVYEDATTAFDKGNYDKSKTLYEQVVVMAPEFSTAYRRLGYLELNLNNIDRAEELTRKALGLEPNSYNQSSLALILLQKNTTK